MKTKLPRESRQRLGLVIAIALACGSASAAEPPRAPGNDAHKIEYAKVEGRECLQPVVKIAGAVIADYRDAEQRWLSAHYPGRPAPRWQNQLVLRAGPNGSVDSSAATMQSETAYVQAGDGGEIAVCFDIGLNSTGTDRRPSTDSGGAKP